MSIAALNWALNVQTESSSQKLVLLLLANFADEQARSWPSQKVVAEKACLSVRSVVTALAELEKAGLIRREARWRPGGSRGTDIIHLSVDGSSTQNLHQSAKDANSARLTKHAKNVDQTCKNGESKRAKPAHLTTFEPPLEPPETRSDAIASGSPAAPDVPLPLSLVDRLWIEGKAGMMGNGVSEREAGSIIGTALKLTGNDHGRVFWAVSEAIRRGSGSPRALVMRLIRGHPENQGAPPRAGPAPDVFSKNGTHQVLAEFMGYGNVQHHDEGSDLDFGSFATDPADGGSHRSVHQPPGGEPERLSEPRHLRVVGSDWR